MLQTPIKTNVLPILPSIKEEYLKAKQKYFKGKKEKSIVILFPKLD
jgi:hypothetical protein